MRDSYCVPIQARKFEGYTLPEDEDISVCIECGQNGAACSGCPMTEEA